MLQILKLGCLVFPSVIFLLLSSGCKSQDFYVDKAVVKARSYAIEKLPELSEADKHQVKFTKPVLLQKRLFSRAAKGEESRRDFIETNIVWKSVDNPANNIIIFGSGQRIMNDWTPYRAIVKDSEESEIEVKDEE